MVKISLIFLLILLDTGGAYKRTTYILFIISLLFLYHKYRRGSLYVETKQGGLWKGIILFSGIISAFIGIDTYESIYGVIRLLTIFVVGFAIRQIEEKERIQLIQLIPYMGIGLSMCSRLHHISFFQNWMSNTGRLAGSFEYPNTMALFLLLGIVISENMFRREKWILQVILSLGILATGSRTVFILLCGYYVFYFCRYQGKNKAILFTFAIMIFSIFIPVSLGKSMVGLERFLSFDLNASTLQGRLLYWEDACRMLWKYPLGVGYMGYFYLQQMMQTGVYSVRFVHNEWLQLMLDYGVLAGVGTLAYMLHCFKVEKIQEWKKEVLVIIGVYCFFDFHLQYWSILLIVLLLVPQGEYVVIGTKKKCASFCFNLVTMALVFILGCTEAANVSARKEKYEEAVQWNPLSVEYQTELMLSSPDLETASVYVEDILQNNSYIYPAYLIRSNMAAEQRQLDQFIENRKQVLLLRKYKIDEYEEYFRILFMWYLESYEANDEESMQQCIDAMGEIPQLIKKVKQETSVRALKIKEKPELYFNYEYEEIIQNLQRRNIK